MEKQTDKIKCVLLGDQAVGKTSLIVSYTTDGYAVDYVPTAMDTYDVSVTVNGEPIVLEMNDTPGHQNLLHLRSLVYPNTDVFILCFSVVSPSSFDHIKERWISEIRKTANLSSKIPIFLVGTQSDLREDAKTLMGLTQKKMSPVSEAEAEKMRSALKCVNYIETSSVTQRNLKGLFDEVITYGLKAHRKRERKLASESSSKQCKGCLLL